MGGGQPRTLEVECSLPCSAVFHGGTIGPRFHTVPSRRYQCPELQSSYLGAPSKLMASPSSTFLFFHFCIFTFVLYRNALSNVRVTNRQLAILTLVFFPLSLSSVFVASVNCDALCKSTCSPTCTLSLSLLVTQSKVAVISEVLTSHTGHKRKRS